MGGPVAHRVRSHSEPALVCLWEPTLWATAMPLGVIKRQSLTTRCPLHCAHGRMLDSHRRRCRQCAAGHGVGTGAGLSGAAAMESAHRSAVALVGAAPVAD